MKRYEIPETSEVLVIDARAVAACSHRGGSLVFCLKGGQTLTRNVSPELGAKVLQDLAPLEVES